MRAAAVACALLAGCLAPAATEPTAVSVDGLYRWFACPADTLVVATPDAVGRCNVRVTPAGIGPANEVTIAVDPTNPLRLVAGAKDYSLQAGACGGKYDMWFGTYWSGDGGLSWKSGLLPGPDLAVTDKTENALAGYRCGSDPVVFWDGEGRAFYGGGAGRFVAAGPQSGGAMEVFVARSDDGGATYPAAASLMRSQSTLAFQDKYWFTADPRSGVLYATWESFLPAGMGIEIVASRSSDHGETWSAPVVISSPLPGITRKFSMPQVDSRGSVYAIWSEWDDASVWLTRSDDEGATWSTPSSVLEIAGFFVGNLPPTEFRAFTMPILGIDRSGGEADGRLYVAWSAQTEERGTDVFLVWSDDSGASWTEPLVVNDDRGPSDQLMPWLAVGPEGDVHVAFYDRRDDPGNRHLHVFYAHVAGGRVAPNVRVTEHLINASLSFHQSGAEFIGDYIGVDEGADGRVHIIWTDTRAGRAEAFTAALAREPGAARLGVDDAVPGTHVPSPGLAKVRGVGLAEPVEYEFEGHLDVPYYCLPAGDETVQEAVADRAGAFHEFAVPRGASAVDVTLAWEAGTPGRALEDLELEVYDAQGEYRGGSYAEQPERVGVELFEGDEGTWTIAVYMCTSVPTDYRVEARVT